jgi:peptidyl-prolyl cis-trans isomerase SurA
MTRLLLLAAAVAVAAGCAGKSAPAAPTQAADRPSSDELRPGDVRVRAVEVDDDITDRVIAVVNNDAITLGELQESIVAFRQENRQRQAVSDDELARQFLSRLIDTRLQLQEAEREKIEVEDAEVAEELAARVKRHGVTSQAELDRLLKEQGLSLEAVRARVRDALRVSKVVRRKVTLRISVTDQEVEEYLAQNRANLETGLSYRARHILVVPEPGAGDGGVEAARIKAEMLRARLLDGADFAEIARTHSQDATARDGGDLGPLKRGELAQDIEAVILALEPGEVSRPHRSALGWHLFRLDSREALEGEGLVRAKQQIRDILFRQKYQARMEAWLEEVKRRAIIEVRM